MDNRIFLIYRSVLKWNSTLEYDGDGIITTISPIGIKYKYYMLTPDTAKFYVGFY